MISISKKQKLAFFCAVGILLCPFARADVQLSLISNAVTQPIDIVSMKDGRTMLVAEQGGRIKRLTNGVIESAPFFDISSKVSSGGERGLLGLALHPKFASNGHFFVNYTRAGDGATIIARFTTDPANPRFASVATEKILLTVAQPYANHNGGGLRFGADGFLYIGLGDGGSGNDPQNYGQNMQSLLGKMLRIDIDRGEPYGIPADNPFAPNPSAGRPEIFAAGLRNPWRFSFDQATGDLFIGDVGQDAQEEIDVISAVTTQQFPRALINFGWRTFEGTRCTGLDGAAACATPGKFAPPIFVYGRDEGKSITGGIVYNGGKVPEIAKGQYVFGDFVSGRIWALQRDPLASPATWTSKLLVSSGSNIASFGEDDVGEIYVLDYVKGIFKLTSTTPPNFFGTAVEYFNTTLNHYFITADAAEQRSVETGGAGPGWQRTGNSFRVLNDVSTALPAPGTTFQNVCRFYGTPGKGPNSHFYTANAAECAAVKKDAGWTYEGTAFYVIARTDSSACVTGGIPVLRSYNKRFAQNDSNHRYTISPVIQQQMANGGWADEGQVFCAIASN